MPSAFCIDASRIGSKPVGLVRCKGNTRIGIQRDKAPDRTRHARQSFKRSAGTRQPQASTVKAKSNEFTPPATGMARVIDPSVALAVGVKEAATDSDASIVPVSAKLGISVVTLPGAEIRENDIGGS